MTKRQIDMKVTAQEKITLEHVDNRQTEKSGLASKDSQTERKLESKVIYDQVADR
jgi:hypothetical protein